VEFENNSFAGATPAYADEQGVVTGAQRELVCNIPCVAGKLRGQFDGGLGDTRA
jgi:hypothetical protein